MFPLSSVLPFFETHCKFVLINYSRNGSDSHFAHSHLAGITDVFGSEFVSVHNILEQPTHLYDAALIGEIHIGDPSAELISSIIKSEEREMDQYLESDLIQEFLPCHRKVFICGPPSFTGTVSEAIISANTVSESDLVIMGHDQYLK